MSEVRYVVEWCAEMPQLPDGDADIDRAKYERRICSTFKDAVKLAKRMIWFDEGFGSVLVEQQEFRREAETETHWARRYWDLTGTLYINSNSDKVTPADFERP